MATISNYYVDNTVVSGTSDADLIDNHGKYVTVETGEGNDTISNYGGGVKITAGDGDDSVYCLTSSTVNNDYGYVTIDGGSGNDIIESFDYHLSISGGAGSDSIYLNNYGNNTIKAGTGNDNINLGYEGSNNVIQYDNSDGVDTVYGYNSTDSIQVSSTAYSTVLSNEDFIINVDSGSLILKNAATQIININGNSINLVESGLYISNSNDDTVITGGAYDDTIFNNGENALIYAGDGNDIVSTESNGVTVIAGEGNDSVYSNHRVTVDGGTGDDTINVMSGYVDGGEGNDVILTDTYNNTTVVAGLGDDTIYTTSTNAFDYGRVFQYISGDGDDIVYGFKENDTLVISADVYSTVAVDNDIIITVDDIGSITLKDSVGININITGAQEEVPAWKIEGNVAIYGTAREMLAVVSGISSDAEAEDFQVIDETTVVISDNALETDSTVSISYGYALQLGDDVDEPIDKAAYWSIDNGVASYNSTSRTAGYVVSDDGKSISYSPEIAGETLITITGLSSSATSEDLILNDNVVTVNNSALDSSNITTIDGDYTLALGDNVVKSVATSEGWNIVDGTANYNAAGQSAGYVLSSDSKSISYLSEIVGETITTITGLSSNATSEDLTINGNVVIVNSAALDSNKTARIDSGYELAFGSDIVPAEESVKSWIIEDSTAVYIAKNIEGYSLSADSQSIVYSNDNSSARLIAISGINSDVTVDNGIIDGISLDGESVKIDSSVIGSEGLTYDGQGYSFETGDGADLVHNIANGISIVGGKGKDIITNSGDFNTLIGGKGKDVINIEGSSAVVSYALGDGNDVVNGYTSDATINMLTDYDTLISGDDVCLVASNNATLKLADAKGQIINIINASGVLETIETADKFTYNKNGVAVTLHADFEGEFSAPAKVKRVVGSQAVANITVSGNALDNTIVGGSGKDYLSGDSGNDSIVGGKGADWLDGGIGNDTLIGNQGADILDGGIGNDILTGGKGKDVFVYASGGGDDTITDYTEFQDVIKLTKGKVKSEVFDGDDIILNVGTGSITVKNGKNKTIKIIDKSGTSTTRLYSDNLSLSDSDDSVVTINDLVETVDASTRTMPIKIVGNSKENVIIGGKGSDTLQGAAGADSIIGGAGKDVLIGNAGGDTLYGGKGKDILTGGKGNDVFIVSNGEGEDLITDYHSDEDIIKVRGNILNATTVGSTKDIVLNFKAGSVTLKNAKNLSLSLVDTNDQSFVTVVGDDDGDVSVAADDSADSILKLSAGTIIFDASARSEAIKITGNIRSNSIVGGSAEDSLYGDDGNDYLAGGNGKDRLYGQAGNDTLFGGAGADFLAGGEGDDSLKGGKGHDTLNGSKGDDTLIGGAGNNIFIYKNGDGNDVITDYKSSDQIRITGIYSTVTSENDFIINVGSGSLTLKDAANINVRIINESGYEERWFEYDEYETSGINDELDSIISTKSDIMVSNYSYQTSQPDDLLQLNKLTYNDAKKDISNK